MFKCQNTTLRGWSKAIDKNMSYSFYLLGVNVTALTIGELHEAIERAVVTNKKACILNVNINAMNIAWKDREFRNILNSADIVFCDGAGVALGAHILSERVPGRITYADWMWDLANFCEIKGYSMFFLGSKNSVARIAADKLLERHKRLRIVGCHHGYFEKKGFQNERVIQQLNS